MGFVQWFPIGEQKLVEDTIKDLETLNIKHLRTGFSWADFDREDRENPSNLNGREWYDWLMPRLKAANIELLPDFLYIPLEKARPDKEGNRRPSHAPQKPEEYGDFVARAIDLYGDCFDYVEIFNEPHLRQEWNPDIDPDFRIYDECLKNACEAAHERGKKTVLGGFTAHHIDWLDTRAKAGAIAFIDVIGFHAFQHCKWGAKHSDRSLSQYARDIQAIARPYGFTGSVWLTEVGYPTAGEEGVSEDRQVEIFKSLQQEDELERAYWWSIADLNPKEQSYTESQIGFHEDSFYHFGIKTFEGKPKKLYRVLEEERSLLSVAK